MPVPQDSAVPATAALDGLRSLVTTADRDHESVPVEAPFTGETVGAVPQAEADDVAAALDRARTAQAAWADRPVAERAAVILRFHDLVLRRRDELMDVMQLEAGKARRDAYEEVLDAATTARHYAHRADGYLQTEKRRGAIPLLTTTRVHHHPVGVVGLIAPWNYPLVLTVSEAIPALLAGNAVVLNPAEQTPFTALLGKQLLVEAGLPEDLFQVVTGHGEPVGEPLVAGANYVGFTGSTAVGRQIAGLAGEHLVEYSMELGGHNPMVVLDDADVEAAVDGALKGAFSNAGQLCIAIERIYVHESLYGRFLDRFGARADELSLGTGDGFDVEVGSLISGDHLRKVSGHVEGAADRGATVVAGGEARPDVGPYFFEPTVLTDVPAGATVADEETFGPVVTVEPYRDLDDAVRRANDSDYGLHAAVWTGDRRRGHRVATRIEAGTVAVNDAYVAPWAAIDAPMGGTKDSGIGRRHGEEGFYKFTRSQTVASARSGPLFFPADGDFETLADRMTTLLKYVKHLPGLR